MSYRLIDANALAANHKQANDMPCIYADLPNGLDNSYYNLARSNSDKSRWFELFGTPERAARTLERNCDEYNCFACPALEVNCYGGNYDALLRWLESEVRDD